jgi:hypothetical protein
MDQLPESVDLAISDRLLARSAADGAHDAIDLDLGFKSDRLTRKHGVERSGDLVNEPICIGDSHRASTTFTTE